MRENKFYIALFGVFVAGIVSVIIYKQQEMRALDFEGYEISSIKSRVDSLYNNDKPDIQRDIEDTLIELEQIFSN